MKSLIAAIALTIAIPAAAQTTQPAADPQTGHEGHKDCCGTEGGKAMPCCDKAKAGGKPMACCDKHAKTGGADAHAGHDMSKH